MATKSNIPDEVWDAQADLYELGLKHQVEIARDLGVSPQTVGREMRRRGARKGSRVGESVASITAELDRKAKRSALMALSETERRQQKQQAGARLVGQMIAAVMEADRQGDLSLADPVIERTAMAFGHKVGRRRR